MNFPDRYKKSGKKFTDGGMSSALLYRDQHLKRDVIIKLLHAQTDQKRLLDEIRALSSIRSKHVVEVYDVIRNKEHKVRAIVEEFIPGASLASKMGSCDTDETLRIALAISTGIGDIHAAGRIHRDIKPQNMKFDAEDCLKIFDFGLSREEDVDAATTGLVGTLGYLAPELCVAEGAEVEFTQAVDVFAFASTILALIRGSLPKGLVLVPPVLPCAAADFSHQKVALPKKVADLLNECHLANPKKRPAMLTVRDAIAAHILHNQHRASLVVSGVIHVLSGANPTVNVKGGTLGSFQLSYDGGNFFVKNVTGAVFINNAAVTPPFVLPGSCCITLGSPAMGSSRQYVPVDVSHPEVML